MKYCIKCNKKVHNQNITGLCRTCYKEKEDIEIENRFQQWLLNGDLGIKVGTTLRGKLRDKLLEYYNNCCNICNIYEWNNKPLVLILDHIDGDASNNKKDNLRFVCPNCDSQLETYKSKNKNSARNHRKKYK